MNFQVVYECYQDLLGQLKDALSKMELTDRVLCIRGEIRKLQEMCPHNNGSYNFSNDDQCPYCGKKFKE